MKIALTKKLTDAMGLKLPTDDETTNPLFVWTANWTRVWENRKAEDMLVLVNNATRFTVAVYQVKRKDLKNIEKIMKDAIVNTLISMHYNPELVDEYMRLAGDLEYVRNGNRQAASWVTRAGLECAYHVGRKYNDIGKMYSDILGTSINYRIVNYSRNYQDSFTPYQAMINALAELTGKPPYKLRALELMVSLDLEAYTAERRIIVPADMELSKLHTVLQKIFSWKNYHLYDFSILDEKKEKIMLRLVPNEEDLHHDDQAVLMKGRTLSEFFPLYDQMIYIYDMGDYWQHDIQLVRVIEEYNEELPYLLEAKGQTPPEDVGGIPGFLSFREIMQNPKHPDYRDILEWSRYWSPDLSKWQTCPGVIHI